MPSSTITFSEKAVLDVTVGDVIANLGVVHAVPLAVGAFMIIPVRGTIWSLGTGRGDIAIFDIIRHQSEAVVVIEMSA